MCTVCKGLLAIQSWPSATNETHHKVLTIHSIITAVHERAPLTVKLFDIVFDKGTLFLCYEYCSNGSLYDALKKVYLRNHLPWLVSKARSPVPLATPHHQPALCSPYPVPLQALVPLLVTLHHMHELGIVHRGVTPHAVLFRSSGTACVGSFQNAAYLDTLSCADAFQEVEGYLEYSAPEMLLCSAYNEERQAGAAALMFGQPIDVWALGVTVYTAVTGREPFTAPATNNERLFEKVRLPSCAPNAGHTAPGAACRGAAVVSFDAQTPAGGASECLWLQVLFEEPVYPATMDVDAADFIARCLRKQPAERPAVTDLMSHPFIAKYTSAPIRGTPPDSHYELADEPEPPEEARCLPPLALAPYCPFPSCGPGLGLALSP